MDGNKPQKPKRFLVFAYDMYYPDGGWNDLLGSADTLEDARKLYLGIESRDTLGEIVDIETGEGHALTADELVAPTKSNMSPLVVDYSHLEADQHTAYRHYAYLNQIHIADMTDAQKDDAWYDFFRSGVPVISNDKTRVLLMNKDRLVTVEAYARDGKLAEGYQVIFISDIPEDYE